MKIAKYDVVFQEIPGEISLALYVKGCPLRCQGCHSSELWTNHGGTHLTTASFSKLLDHYGCLATCVLFMGGDWCEAELCDLLDLARSRAYLTALYTGSDDVSSALRGRLDFLKTGPWIETLGGLASLKTNQLLLDLRTNSSLNPHFQPPHQGEPHVHAPERRAANHQD